VPRWLVMQVFIGCTLAAHLGLWNCSFAVPRMNQMSVRSSPSLHYRHVQGIVGKVYWVLCPFLHLSNPQRQACKAAPHKTSRSVRSIYALNKAHFRVANRGTHHMRLSILLNRMMQLDLEMLLRCWAERGPFPTSATCTGSL
jgi:hypothetical protein